MKYAALRTCDVANGDGVRVSLFVSGCTHHCPGCFNLEAQSFDYGAPFTAAVEDEILDACDKSYISGLTVLGGEPMEPQNQRGLLTLLRRFRARFGGSKTIWIYTGCVIEELRAPSVSRWRTEVTDEILSLIDILVDGPFVMALRDPSLKFRGSSNQRILSLRG